MTKSGIAPPHFFAPNTFTPACQFMTGGEGCDLSFVLDVWAKFTSRQNSTTSGLRGWENRSNQSCDLKKKKKKIVDPIRDFRLFLFKVFKTHPQHFQLFLCQLCIPVENESPSLAPPRGCVHQGMRIHLWSCNQFYLLLLRRDLQTTNGNRNNRQQNVLKVWFGMKSAQYFRQLVASC